MANCYTLILLFFYDVLLQSLLQSECENRVWLGFCLPQMSKDSPHPGPRTITPAAFYNVQRFLPGHNERINFAFFSLFTASQLFSWSAFCLQHVQHHLQREKLFTIREGNVCTFWAHWSMWLGEREVCMLQCCLRWKQVELQKVQGKKAGVTFWEPCVMLHYQTGI